MTFSQRNKLDLRIAKYEKIEFLDLILQIFKKRLSLNRFDCYG